MTFISLIVSHSFILEEINLSSRRSILSSSLFSGSLTSSASPFSNVTIEDVRSFSYTKALSASVLLLS